MPRTPRATAIAALLLAATVSLSGCGIIKGGKSAQEWAVDACHAYTVAGIGDSTVDPGARLSSLDDAVQYATRAAGLDTAYQPLVRAFQAARTAGRSVELGKDATLIPETARQTIEQMCPGPSTGSGAATP